MFSDEIIYDYRYIGDYTLRYYSYLSKYLSYFDNTKVTLYFNISKHFRIFF